MFEINECDCPTTNLVEAEKTIAILRERLAAAERERDEATRYASNIVEHFITICRKHKTSNATQSAALEKAREALKVGRAWSEEYLVECEELPVEAERVRGGLVTIDKAIAAVEAALTGRACR